MTKLVARKPLRKGTLLYHGTSAEDDFEALEGPAWVSTHSDVARNFVSWAGGGGQPRVLTFRVVSAPRLAIIESEDDLLRWIARSGIDPEGVDPREAAEAICRVNKIDGWHIEDNYGRGRSDTMLCHPISVLELVGRQPVKTGRW